MEFLLILRIFFSLILLKYSPKSFEGVKLQDLYSCVIYNPIQKWSVKIITILIRIPKKKKKSSGKPFYLSNLTGYGPSNHASLQPCAHQYWIVLCWNIKRTLFKSTQMINYCNIYLFRIFAIAKESSVQPQQLHDR